MKTCVGDVKRKPELALLSQKNQHCVPIIDFDIKRGIFVVVVEDLRTSGRMNFPNKQVLARKRWDLLRRAIQKKSVETVDNPGSKRSFENYSEILSISSIGKNLLRAQLFVDEKLYELCVHREEVTWPFSLKVLLEDLSDFDLDRTGRITIWPSSQILTYWCLKNINYFDGKSVLELGCGFHALPGLAIAKFSGAEQVLLSDGDPKSCADVARSVELNSLKTKKTNVVQFKWEDFNDSGIDSRFDCVIAADIVYFTGTFHVLVDIIWKLLKPGGRFVLFNPSRVSKLSEFISIAETSNRFSSVHVCEDYDNFVTRLAHKIKVTNPCYVPEWHYPLQVILDKY